MKLAIISAAFILLATFKVQEVESSCCCCCCKPCCCCCCPCCCCCCCCCCKPCCCCCCCKPCCCCCPCCCGGRRKRALASAAARGALGNAALVPRVNEPGRQSRSCGGQCQDCKVNGAASSSAASPVPSFSASALPQQRQCRQCTPEEEKQCLDMLAQQKAAAPVATGGLHSYRKFKRAIALEKPAAGGCGVATTQQKDCKC